ncbi:hypothetical protein Pelo_4777 [Pelomyxa schiedti]|nr:hypothetical protein Pelo_4777 [Pelomyxa schiedti]
MSKQVTVYGTIVQLELHESGGLEMFTAMKDIYFDYINIVLLCFSLADAQSFDSVIVLLVGLQMDLLSEIHREVAFHSGVAAAIKTESYGYFQCSSKLQIGLEFLFESVGRAGLFVDPIGTKPKPPRFFSFNFSFFSKSSHKGLDSQPVISTLRTLDIQALKLTLEYLDFVSLIRISRTCKPLYNLAKTEPLWTNAQNGSWTYPGFSRGIGWQKSSFLWDPTRCFPIWDAPAFKNRDYLEVGDSVASSVVKLKCNETQITSTATVCCIWKCPVVKPTLIISVVASPSDRNCSLLEITPDHPILHNNKWCLPTVLGEPYHMDPNIDCVYNIVVQSNTDEVGGRRTTVVVGGIVCCTLGMSVPGYEDPFWGSECVVEWLQSRHDFPWVHASPPTWAKYKLASTLS